MKRMIFSSEQSDLFLLDQCDSLLRGLPPFASVVLLKQFYICQSAPEWLSQFPVVPDEVMGGCSRSLLADKSMRNWLRIGQM